MLGEDEQDDLAYEDIAFTAKVTAHTAGTTNQYTIVEQVIGVASDGLVDADPGRSGAARERNNAVVPVGTFVDARFRGVFDGQPLYEFDFGGGSSGGGGTPGTITVREADLTPTLTAVSILEFDQADGFAVSVLGTNGARIDLVPATPTQTGV